MSVPVPIRTWVHNVNNVVASGATALETYQKVLFGIKNALKGFANVPWTVQGSSNGTTAAMDSVDRWTAYTDVNWLVSSTFSWIVLRGPAWFSGGTGSVCLSLTHTGDTGCMMDITVSPVNSFTGGSTSSRPSATGELALNGNQYWVAKKTSPFAATYHVIKETLSQTTRIFVCSGGFVIGYMAFDRLANPSTGTVTNVALMTTSMDTNPSHHCLTYATYGADQVGSLLLYKVGVGVYPSSLTTELTLNIPIGQRWPGANEISGEYFLSPIGLALTTPTIQRGRQGTLVDAWWGRTAPSSGPTYPGDGSRAFATFGDMVVPWNGTVVNMS